MHPPLGCPIAFVIPPISSSKRDCFLPDHDEIQFAEIFTQPVGCLRATRSTESDGIPFAASFLRYVHMYVRVQKRGNNNGESFYSIARFDSVHCFVSSDVSLTIRKICVEIVEDRFDFYLFI